MMETLLVSFFFFSNTVIYLFKYLQNIVQHEMIHALLFVTQQNTDRGKKKHIEIYEQQVVNLVLTDGHGPPFLKVAKRINDAAGFDISVYHK